MLICFAFGKKTLKLIQAISKTAEKVLSIDLLPQQAAVERLKELFSDAGKKEHVYRPEGCFSLSDSKFEQLMFLLDQILSIKKINSYSNGL